MLSPASLSPTHFLMRHRREAKIYNCKIKIVTRKDEKKTKQAIYHLNV